MALFEEVDPGDSWTTAGRTITESDVTQFAGLTGDFNGLHLDAVAAGESVYGERIAHGALVFGTLIGLIWQRRTPAERDAVVAFYGVDELRFTGPVHLGETIRATVTVLGKERREHPVATGVVRHEATVEVLERDGGSEETGADEDEESGANGGEQTGADANVNEDAAVLTCELLSLVE